MHHRASIEPLHFRGSVDGWTLTTHAVLASRCKLAWLCNVHNGFEPLFRITKINMYRREYYVWQIRRNMWMFVYSLWYWSMEGIKCSVSIKMRLTGIVWSLIIFSQVFSIHFSTLHRPKVMQTVSGRGWWTYYGHLSRSVSVAKHLVYFFFWGGGGGCQCVLRSEGEAEKWRPADVVCFPK